MDSVVQNGRDQLTLQYITLIALTLLYYDYVLTFDRERRFFWSPHNFKQWGSVLFFLNRYCGILGHAPVFIQNFAQPNSALYLFCKRVDLYHQILAVVMQSIIGLTFVARTYALYGRSRIVLVVLVCLGFVCIAVTGCMIAQGKRPDVGPRLPEGSVGCSDGLSWSQSWRLAVAWCCVMTFDVTVFVMTLVRTIQINRRSRKDRTLIHLLMRDGVMYFGVISLSTASNIVLFLRGSEITRGIPTTMTNILGSVLVSRLMFNLREPRELSGMTGATSPVISTTMIFHTLTNLDDVDGAETYAASLDHGDMEMPDITDRSEIEGHFRV